MLAMLTRVGSARLLTSPPAMRLREAAESIVVRWSEATWSWSSSLWKGPRASASAQLLYRTSDATWSRAVSFGVGQLLLSPVMLIHRPTTTRAAPISGV
jgi:hypothetical protein